MSDLDAVYAERDQLVAFLSRCYPSFLAPAPDAEPGFGWIVYVETHEGQLSWHVRDDELPWFDHLPRREAGDWWDGHSTDEKYERLAKLRPNDEPKMTNRADPLHPHVQWTATFYDGYGNTGYIGYRPDSDRVYVGMILNDGRREGITFLFHEREKVEKALAEAFEKCESEWQKPYRRKT